MVSKKLSLKISKELFLNQLERAQDKLNVVDRKGDYVDGFRFTNIKAEIDEDIIDSIDLVAFATKREGNKVTKAKFGINLDGFDVMGSCGETRKGVIVASGNGCLRHLANATEWDDRQWQMIDKKVSYRKKSKLR